MSVTPGTPSGPDLTLRFRARPRRREVDPYPVLKDAYARAIALRAASTQGSMRFRGQADVTIR